MNHTSSSTGHRARSDAEGLREVLARSDFVAVLTGAGISAESGVPTFRGSGGLWRNWRPEDLATPEAFAHDPRLVWEWYDWRRSLIRKAEPNLGHRALAKLESRKAGQSPLRAPANQTPAPQCSERPEHDAVGQGCFTLITQNVDGLHERAGSQGLVKLHGDIWRLCCVGCGLTERNEQVPLDALPPRCRCGALMRPGVVWFGEPLPEDEWRRAVEASRAAQIFMLVGTSAVVYPAAGLAELALEAGARLAIVNPEPTPFDHLADWVLRGPAGEILPQVCQ